MARTSANIFEVFGEIQLQKLDKQSAIDQCCNTAPQFFMAYGEIRLSFLWLTADSQNLAK